MCVCKHNGARPVETQPAPSLRLNLGSRDFGLKEKAVASAASHPTGPGPRSGDRTTSVDNRCAGSLIPVNLSNPPDSYSPRILNHVVTRSSIGFFDVYARFLEPGNSLRSSQVFVSLSFSQLSVSRNR